MNQLLTVLNSNPQELFDYMLKTNPQFARFVDSCKGKSLEQIATEHGIDPNRIKDFISNVDQHSK